MKLREPYKQILDELVKDRYKTWTLYNMFIKQERHPAKVNVALRIDCDWSISDALDIAKELRVRNLSATFCVRMDGQRYEISEHKEALQSIAGDFEIALHASKGLQGRYHYAAKMLSEACGKQVKGMTFHETEEVWHDYKDTPPAEFGLEYHDGCTKTRVVPSHEINPATRYFDYTHEGIYCESKNGHWRPPANHWLSDNLLVRNAWSFVPWYPLKKLRHAQLGETIHLTFHTLFPYRNVDPWNDYKEYPLKESLERNAKAHAYAYKKTILGD